MKLIYLLLYCYINYYNIIIKKINKNNNKNHLNNIISETNLKRRTALSQFSGIRSLDELLRVNCVIHCEKPNDNLTSFDGSISIVISKKTNRLDEKDDGFYFLLFYFSYYAFILIEL